MRSFVGLGSTAFFFCVALGFLCVLQGARASEALPPRRALRDVQSASSGSSYVPYSSYTSGSSPSSASGSSYSSYSYSSPLSGSTAATNAIRRIKPGRQGWDVHQGAPWNPNRWQAFGNTTVAQARLLQSSLYAYSGSSSAGVSLCPLPILLLFVTGLIAYFF